MMSQIPTPRAALPAHREAVRLLDCLIGSADPAPRNGGTTFAAILTEPVFDRLTLWLMAEPVATSYTPDPIAAAQREAARLLRAIMSCLLRAGPAPGGGLRLVFEWDDDLHDRAMVWGSAIEDCEILDEDDEDGADAERPDHPPEDLTALDVGVPQDMAGLVLDLYAGASHPAPEVPGHLSTA